MLCPRCGKEVGDLTRNCASCEAIAPVETHAESKPSVAAPDTTLRTEDDANLLKSLIARIVSERNLFFVGLGFVFFVQLLYFLLVLGSPVSAAAWSSLGSAAIAFGAARYAKQEAYDLDAIDRLAKRIAAASLVLLLISII